MKDKNAFFVSCVETSLKEIEGYLLSVGFSVNPDVRWEKGRICRPFIRDAEKWKSDAVNVLYPKSDNALADATFLVGFRITLNEKGNGSGLYYDGVDMAYVVGKKSGNYEVPRSALFEARAKANFAGELVADIKQAIPWFEARGTVEECICLLREGKTNAGFLQESGAAQRALQALESWKSEALRGQ